MARGPVIGIPPELKARIIKWREGKHDYYQRRAALMIETHARATEQRAIAKALMERGYAYSTTRRLMTEFADLPTAFREDEHVDEN